jgi:hypothetical protein
MPDVDGFMVAAQFRHSTDPIVKNATLIAHTGLVSLPHRIRAMGCGFDYYLIKPDAIDYIEACLGIQKGITDMRRFAVPKIDYAKLAALSERSKLAVQRAQAVCQMYRQK